MLKNTKVLVGFSGGVDSTAAVILLQKAGYEVVGLCFNVLDNYFSEKTQAAADRLGIKLINKCVASEFKEKVINPFILEYENGRTPNPCILCNPAVKFKTLIEAADEEGIYYIATGHYARTQLYDGKYYIAKAKNERKDQSYMLYRLPEDIIERLILPLGGAIDKADVRRLVQEENIANFGEKDSQDICFIPDGDYKSYLMLHGAINKPGNFIDTDGVKLGQHQGILSYTVGQRKGLGLSLGKPSYVLEIKDNDVVVGSEESLFQNNVTVNQLFWTGFEATDGMKLRCKLRYSAKDAECTIKRLADGKIELIFDEAQRAPTPGQSAVLYYNQLVIGGGFIVK